MPENANIRKCRTFIQQSEKNQYFSTALPVYRRKIESIKSQLIDTGIEEAEATKQAEKKIFAYLSEVMRESQPLVENYIDERVNNGEISDANQARKSAAGNIFQRMVAYTFAKNIVNGNINVPVIVTMSVKQIVSNYASISVGDEENQMPDSDIIIYSDTDNTSPIVNFSCKTSFRERAGQTMRWKLLIDLATCGCEHCEENDKCPVKKYNLSYEPQRPVKVCFISADFYNEIEQPQIRGMFSFFDYAYIAKPTTPIQNIKTLPDVIEDINALFS